MAVPLEPESGLFPDTLVEPFVGAPELADLAEQVISEFDEFDPIRRAIADQGLAIGYVWETKPFDPESEEYKPHTIAKVTKASPLWRCISDLHLVIQFRRTFWDEFDAEQRRAIVHHELSHVLVDVDQQGRLKVALRPHDVEDFWLTVRRFGPILPGRAAFLKAITDWQREHAGEPTPLRPVEEIEAGVHAAIDFKREMGRAGFDVTVEDGNRIVVRADEAQGTGA